MLVLAGALLATRALGAEALVPASESTPILRLRSDLIGIRLRLVAARQVSPRSASGRAKEAASGFLSPRLGLAGLDAAAGRLGVLAFEREFPAGPPVIEPPMVRAAQAAGEGSASALDGFWLVHLPVGLSRERAMAELATAREVASAWPIAIVEAAAVPDDSLWSDSTPSRAPVRFFWQAAEPLDSEPASIHVLDLQGRRVAVLALDPGREGIATWDGRDARGRRASAGVYFARLVMRHGRATARLVMLD